MKSNFEFYDAFAAHYEAFYSRIDWAEAVRQWLLMLEVEFPCSRHSRSDESTRTLIDIGCGPGWHLQAWRDAGFDVHGLDFSPAMLERAARNVPGVPLYCADLLDARSLAPLAKRFDLAVSHFNFLNLFAPEALPQAFTSVASLLSRGGLWATDVTLEWQICEEPQSEMEVGEHARVISREAGEISESVCVTWWLDGKAYNENYWIHPVEWIECAAKSAGFVFQQIIPWQPQVPSDPWSSSLATEKGLVVSSKS